MKYKMPKSEQEARELLETLKQSNGKDFSNKNVIKLGNIMLNINPEFGGIRDIIALRYSEADNKLCIPFLIEAIKRNIHTKYVSSLIYACSFYDCSEHLQLFIDLLVLKTDMCFVDSYYVIQSMHTISSKLEKLYGINKLKAFKATISKDYSLWNELDEAIELLEGK